MSYSQFIPPYDPIRYRHVMENAVRLKNEIAYRSNHLRKTKACMNAYPHDIEKCPFAHSLEEYRLPECFYAEFCKNNDCVMFHPGRNCTVEQYIQKNNITFPEKNEKNKKVEKTEKKKAVGLYTRFCNLMTETSPCQRGYCTFAHGLDQLNLPEDPTKDRLTIAKELGYEIKDWMMRPHQENISKKENRFTKAAKENDEMMEELRKEEELIDQIKKMTMEDEEEEEDDDDDDGLIVIVNPDPSKSGMCIADLDKLSESVFDRME